jgi:hypothetical protein
LSAWRTWCSVVFFTFLIWGGANSIGSSTQF